MDRKKMVLQDAINELYRARVSVSLARSEIDPAILSDDYANLLNAWDLVDMALKILERMK